MGNKKKIKILYITFSPIDMNTSATIRNKALIKGLVKNGAKIDLLTLTAARDNNYFDSIVDSIDGVNIIKLKQNAAYLAMVKHDESLKGKLKKKILPIARRIYHSFNLYDNSILVAKNIGKDILPSDYYDIIITSSDPKTSHIAAQKLIDLGLNYGKWIQYWGDPLSIDITNKSLYPKWYVRKVEENIIKMADTIIYVSPFTLREQMKLFPKYSEKMSFLPVPYLEPKFSKNKQEYNKKITLGYFGDYHSSIRDIRPLYEFAKKSGDGLIIAGNADLNLKSSENVTIYPRLCLEEITKLETVSDILVCILNKRGTQIPGKLYHYAATNKPILVILDGEYRKEIADYLRSFNRYILCDNNEQDIKQAINKIKGQNYTWEPSPYFSPEAIAKKFLEISMN